MQRTTGTCTRCRAAFVKHGGSQCGYCTSQRVRRDYGLLSRALLAGASGQLARLAALVLACTFVVGPRAEGLERFKVVVNAANPVSTLTVKETSDLFLGKTSRWPDGMPVKPVDLSAVSPLREAFTEEVHGKKVAAIVNHWQQMIFSGRGVPPPSRPTDQEVLAYVKANPGAIGYVSAEVPTIEVKVIALKR